MCSDLQLDTRRTLGTIRWSMLLSHHAPCDYDHTLTVMGVRICVRCTGITIGAVVFTLLLVAFPYLQHFMPLWLPFVLPLPAVVDFTTHELGWWKSSNVVRWISGVLVGIALGWSGYTILYGKALQGVLLVVSVGCFEVIVAILLRTAGQLEGFVQRYEKAVRGYGVVRKGICGGNFVPL